MNHSALLDATELLRLHDRLLDDDVDAKEVIAASLIHTCPRNVGRRLPRADPAVVQDSIDRAVQSFLADPRSFDPTKGRLQFFIERAALRNAIDELRSERARHAREALWAAERARSPHAAEVANLPKTPRDMWPLLMGSRSDLMDHQWASVESLFPPRLERGRGRPPRPARPILDVLIWMLRRGGWQNLPSQHRSSPSARRYFRQWCSSGILRAALDRLEADRQRIRRASS